ncbi:probable calcium-binding protein CML36 [Syzygium oleosum]|uniref:probable calcium-binding protein CML36 n=1 Tax=Syzygium oleosum TaxID=219896 RepID=UPI0024B97C6E|nr:probable calcium-binding protein CML36 [Syzygium oleosum]
MKLIKINRLSPKRLFGSKKDRSDPSSLFGYGATTSSSSSSSCSSSAASSVHKRGGEESRTPTSVLPPQLSGDWSDAASSSDMNCELVRAFTYIDGDKDGVLSRADLEALLSRLGAEPLSADEKALMLREVGCADDGAGAGAAGVSIDDVMSRVGSSGGDPDCDAEMRRTFEFFDRNGDGRITAEELLGAFVAMGDGRCTLEECRRMIAEVDRNGDGFVCFEDFCRMMELQI